jgi:D-glucuronyl C5-epimerase C-terminus
MRRAAAGVAAAAALFAITTDAHASSASVARRGLTHALQRHWLKAADVQRYRGILYRAERASRSLPRGRAAILNAQLAQLTPMSDSYVRPRALALFTQLEVNVDYLETHVLPAGKLDVRGDDGVVYRWFPNKGLQFHPLAAFAALNGSRDPLLAEALVARGIPRGGGLVWEYSFRFGSCRAPWTSGMAQSVAAQALARAGIDVAARRAYLGLAPLTMATSAGPWIRLYSCTREIVLNAQLQSVVSLLEYSADDAEAAELASAMLDATQALLPRFDTGEWSRYELGGGYANRDYQAFVTDLLKKVGRQTQEPFWLTTSQRFYDYLYSPPTITQTAPSPAIWPQPLDGFLDTAPIAFTLSQKAAVTLAVGGIVSTYRLPAGSHTLTWKPPADLAPGTYPVSVSAVTYAGNRRTVPLAPVVVQWDTQPPPVTASLATNVLSWTSTDAGTPWLALAVDLVDPTGAQPPQTLDLGRQPVNGSVTLTLPVGLWDATLRATNSAGLTTTLPLGQVQG